MNRVKGLRSTDWWLQNSRGDVKDSTGNVVSNVIMILCLWRVPGGHWDCGAVFCKVCDCPNTMLNT